MATAKKNSAAKPAVKAAEVKTPSPLAKADAAEILKEAPAAKPAAEKKAAPAKTETKKPAAEKKAAPAKAEAKKKEAPAKEEAKKPAAKKAAPAKAEAKKAVAKKAAPAKAEAKKSAAKKAPKKKEITVETVVEKLTKKLNASAAKSIDGKAAVDIKLYGAFEAHMYIEVKDGVLNVAPYDYIEKDIEAAISVENALAIADGKLTIAEALADGRLYAFGNVAVAAKLAKLF